MYYFVVALKKNYSTYSLIYVGILSSNLSSSVHKTTLYNYLINAVAADIRFLGMCTNHPLAPRRRRRGGGGGGGGGPI